VKQRREKGVGEEERVGGRKGGEVKGGKERRKYVAG